MEVDKIRYFFLKLRLRLLFERNRLWKYISVVRIAMMGYKPVNATDFKYKINSMLGLFDAGLLTGISSEERNLILSSAEQALRHEFDLLGSGLVLLDPIDWHQDFKSRSKWKKQFYRDIARIKDADIKVPWELSRCQHLLWLGEAYLLTKEPKYAQEVIDEICCWIDDNPLMYSVNWTCSMDVAFRAVNWIYAMNMISKYEGFNDEFTLKVSSSLWQHGFYIINNLEKRIPYSNNHYTSDLVGLLFLGELFNETSRGRAWLRYSLREYYSEICKQVLPSGVHYERSVSYHRLMTEMLSYPIFMLKRMGEDVPLILIERIGKMYGYIAT